MTKYPCLNVNLDAIENNAKVICNFCHNYKINVAGVVKFSDCDIDVVKAYHNGGCSQIAVSRAVHLEKIKKEIPDIETLLLRIPSKSEMGIVARFADLVLFSDRNALCALDKEAGLSGTVPGVILMLDVGDLREGVASVDELVELALLAEELPNINLRGVGTSLACLNGVLPTWENLSYLVNGAKKVEEAIGRKLEIISGGSSINLTLLKNGKNEVPPEINHLRIGGNIANPINMRINRNVAIEGMREDSISITAEIVELREKDSAPKNSSAKNWAGEEIKFADKGRRKRAIIAIGSQDIGSYTTLMPMEEGIEVVGGSSDHTIIDVTDSKKDYKWGDTITFQVKYAAMLYGFSGKHININFCNDDLGK